jgi:uncharacterized protein YggU (UPF0235/DUF167 family)
MKLTVRKADGPGWLMIAETVENGLYKVVTERCGEEPPYDVILQFLHRLPRLLDKVWGVSAEEIAPDRPVSAKRAARAANREMERSRNRHLPGKSFRIKGEELEKAAERKRNEIEVRVWVKPGKKRTMLTDETHKGMRIMEVQGSISDGRTHAEIRAALKRLYGVYERDIELIEGYASQFKRYRVTLR